MGKRSGEPPATKLEAFVRHHRVYAVELARASGCSRAGLARMRFGQVETNRRQMAAILAGARLVLPAVDITIYDLFSFDDGPLPAAKKDWHRIRAPGRPRKKRETREPAD
jgi:hypothetical protein